LIKATSSDTQASTINSHAAMHPPPRRARAEGEEVTATSHGRRSWKDSPKAKTIAATISLLLIAGLIVVLTFALLSMQ